MTPTLLLVSFFDNSHRIAVVWATFLFGYLACIQTLTDDDPLLAMMMQQLDELYLLVSLPKVLSFATTSTFGSFTCLF